MRSAVPSHNARRETEIVAKRQNIKRTRTKARRDDVKRTIAIKLTAGQLQLRRQRWRALKKQFDDVHHAGMASLKRRDYDSLRAETLHERRIIDELRALIDEARALVGYKTPHRVDDRRERRSRHTIVMRRRAGGPRSAVRRA